MAFPIKKAARLQQTRAQLLPPVTHPKDNRKTHLNKPSFQPKYKQRLPYLVRHPIDGIWGWLSSVRTAIFLISSIAVICFIGIYFVQAPGEVLNDPVAYVAWIQQNALPRYGSLTPTGCDSTRSFPAGISCCCLQYSRLALSYVH